LPFLAVNLIGVAKWNFFRGGIILFYLSKGSIRAAREKELIGVKKLHPLKFKREFHSEFVARGQKYALSYMAVLSEYVSDSFAIVSVTQDSITGAFVG